MNGNRQENTAVVINGTVTSFDASRGYGYVAQGGGRVLFVEPKVLRSHDPHILAMGERVVFQVIQGPAGPHVGSVRRF